MPGMTVFSPEDLSEQHQQLLPLFQSYAENIPFFGKPSNAQRHLNHVFSKIQKGAMIDMSAPLETLSVEQLLYLLFETLNPTKMKHYFISDSAHPCTESVLEIMSQLLPEKGNVINSTEIRPLIKKIDAIASKIESDRSLVNYAKAGLKLMLVIALGCATALCYYACLASLGLIAVSVFTGPIAFLAVGVFISLGLTFAGLGISAIGAGLKLLKSSFDDVRHTYTARNPTPEQEEALEEQGKILDAIKSKLNDALENVPSETKSVEIALS